LTRNERNLIAILSNDRSDNLLRDFYCSLGMLRVAINELAVYSSAPLTMHVHFMAIILVLSHCSQASQDDETLMIKALRRFSEMLLTCERAHKEKSKPASTKNKFLC